MIVASASPVDSITPCCDSAASTTPDVRRTPAKFLFTGWRRREFGYVTAAPALRARQTKGQAVRGCSNPPPFARAAVVLSLVLASTPVSAAQPAAEAVEPTPEPRALPPPARQVAYASDRERLQALDERYGDAYPDSKGVGMRKAGLILTAVGAAALGVGIPCLAVGFATDSDDGYGSAILLGLSSYLVAPGAIALAVGVPMLVKGSRRRARYHEWLDEQDRRARLSRGSWRMKPLLSAGRSGWAVGLRVTF